MITCDDLGNIDYSDFDYAPIFDDLIKYDQDRLLCNLLIEQFISVGESPLSELRNWRELLDLAIDGINEALAEGWDNYNQLAKEGAQTNEQQQLSEAR